MKVFVWSARDPVPNVRKSGRRENRIRAMMIMAKIPKHIPPEARKIASYVLLPNRLLPYPDMQSRNWSTQERDCERPTLEYKHSIVQEHTYISYAYHIIQVRRQLFKKDKRPRIGISFYDNGCCR